MRIAQVAPLYESVPPQLYGGTERVVDSIEEAVHAVERVAGLGRRSCREVFERRFDAARMTQDYLTVDRRLVHARLDLGAPHSVRPGPGPLPRTGGTRQSVA